MTDAQLTDHDLALVDAVAERVLELLGERDARSRAGELPKLVDAAELAEQLGISRTTVYEHADQLGVVRIGGRLRFDPRRARVAMDREASKRSEAEKANGGRVLPAAAAPAGSQRGAGLPPPGRVLPERPAPRGRRAGRERR